MLAAAVEMFNVMAHAQEATQRHHPMGRDAIALHAAAAELYNAAGHAVRRQWFAMEQFT